MAFVLADLSIANQLIGGRHRSWVYRTTDGFDDTVSGTDYFAMGNSPYKMVMGDIVIVVKTDASEVTLAYVSAVDASNNATVSTPTDSSGVFNPQGSQPARAISGKSREIFTIDDINPNIVRGGATDNTEDIQAFFDTIATESLTDARLVGDFGVSAPLTLTGDATALETDTQDFHLDFKFTALNAITDAMLTISKARYANITGSMRFIGTGTTATALRTCYTALKIRDCSRTNFPYVRAKFFGQYGINIDDQDDGGTNSGLQFQGCSLWDIGVNNVGLSTATATVSARTDSGSSGSTSQRTVITVDTPPPVGCTVACIVVVAGNPHALISQSGNDLTIYPWPDTTFATGSIYYIYGAGIHTRGNDSNVMGFGGADLFRCGIGINSRSLYGAVYQRPMMQSNGVGILWGAPVTSTNVSPTFINPYFETPSPFHMIRQTTAIVGGIVISPYALDFAKCFSLSPRLSGNTLSPNFEMFEGMTFMDAEGMERSGNQQLTTNTTTTISAVMRDGPMGYCGIVRTTSPNITLKAASVDRRRIFRMSDLFIMSMGAGGGGQATGTHTFIPETGYTVMGGGAGVSYTVTNLVGPTLFHATLDSTGLNWFVDMIPFNRSAVPKESYQAIATDANFTLTPGTSTPRTKHTGTLTADRTVTLTTTNAVAGSTRWVITRTGSGSFNLNVGTGPLKALVQNTWAEFVYDGSAYYLAAYGAL